MAKDAEVSHLVATSPAAFGDLHVVVNNAGTTHRNQPMLEVAEAEYDRIYAVNVKSLYLTARHAVPHFRRKRDGVFITIASTAAVFFASDEAAFITGACLEVDGGRCV